MQTKQNKMKREGNNIKSINIRKVLSIIIFLAAILIFSKSNAETIIEGRRSVNLEEGKTTTIEYKIDRNNILRIDNAKSKNGNVEILKHYTSEQSTNRVFIEIKAKKGGEDKITLKFTYAPTNRLSSSPNVKYETLIVKVPEKHVIDAEKPKLEGEQTDNNKSVVDNNNEDNVLDEKQEENSAGNTEDEELVRQERAEYITQVNKLFAKVDELDKERKEKIQEDKKIKEFINKEEFVQKVVILISGIIVMFVHYIRYVKYEKY